MPSHNKGMPHKEFLPNGTAIRPPLTLEEQRGHAHFECTCDNEQGCLVHDEQPAGWR